MPFFAKVRVQNFLREMDANVLLLYERPHELHLFWESNGHNQLLLIKLPCYAGYKGGGAFLDDYYGLSRSPYG